MGQTNRQTHTPTTSRSKHTSFAATGAPKNELRRSTSPSLSTRLLGWLVDRGFYAATRDASVRESLLEVLHLRRPARSLLTPRMILTGVLS